MLQHGVSDRRSSIWKPMPAGSAAHRSTAAAPQDRRIPRTMFALQFAHRLVSRQALRAELEEAIVTSAIGRAEELLGRSALAGAEQGTVGHWVRSAIAGYGAQRFGY